MSRTDRFFAWLWIALGFWYAALAGTRALIGDWGWAALNLLFFVMFVALGFQQLARDRRRALLAEGRRVIAEGRTQTDPWAPLDALLAETHHVRVLEQLPDDVRAALGFPKPEPDPVEDSELMAHMRAALGDGPFPHEPTRTGILNLPYLPAIDGDRQAAELKRQSAKVVRDIAFAVGSGPVKRYWVDGKLTALPNMTTVPWRDRHRWQTSGRAVPSARVRAFQSGVKLPVDGRWGPQTEAKFAELLRQNLVPLQAPEYGATIDVEPGELVRFPQGRTVPMPSNTSGLLRVADCKHEGDRVELAQANGWRSELCSDCGQATHDDELLDDIDHGGNRT